MADDADLLTTPLDALHRRLGARMVGFAGYAMPLQYPDGIMAEHRHCRAAAGLFDVSHMGQIEIRADSIEVAARALERLVPVDVLGLKDGRQRYALFTDGNGGILDDLMVARLGDRLLLVVNAANKAADLEHLTEGLPGCEVLPFPGRGLIALQGPEAGRVLAALAPETEGMIFMDIRDMAIAGIPCTVTRSGYTGEDGFEISVPAEAAEDLAGMLLADAAVKPVGLGARDSLRLEAGLPLHGNDIDPGTTPVEGNLAWAIQKVRRTGGAREGGFPGAGRIMEQLSTGPARLRVGLRPEGRAPIRAGVQLYASEDATDPVGHVTSGVFGPTVEAPVAMGHVATEQSGEGVRLFADLRGRRMPVTVAALPFVPTRYRRSR